jgi:hypothetical protein
MNAITILYLGLQSNSSFFRNTLTRRLCISVPLFNYKFQYKRHFLRTSSAQLEIVGSSILILFSKINMAAENACEGLVVLDNDNIFIIILTFLGKLTSIST